MIRAARGLTASSLGRFQRFSPNLSWFKGKATEQLSSCSESPQLRRAAERARGRVAHVTSQVWVCTRLQHVWRQRLSHDDRSVTVRWHLGLLPRGDISAATLQALKEQFASFSQCLYALWGQWNGRWRRSKIQQELYFGSHLTLYMHDSPKLHNAVPACGSTLSECASLKSNLLHNRVGCCSD